MNSQKIKVGITLGDINGIGCEVVVKTLADSRLLELCTPVIYGSAKVVAHYKKELDEEYKGFACEVINSASEVSHKSVNLINCISDDVRIEPGVSTEEAGKASVGMLDRAIQDIKDGLVDVLVTAPINKKNAQREGFEFRGHTEYLADRFGGSPIMLMSSESMKVGLVTTHLALNEVSENITQEKIVKQLVLLRKTLIEDFGVVEPRIAVLSLNPHTGDEGLLGREEIEIIRPAILEAANQRVLAFGPFAADGFFSAAGYKKYDAVLAMYHDQGLAPFKALASQGVNYTGGLSLVRTSPDHGVAYDIAGKGVADESSMREAIYQAIDAYRSRQRYGEMSSNPLKHYEREKGADVSVHDLPQVHNHNH